MSDYYTYTQRYVLKDGTVKSCPLKIKKPPPTGRPRGRPQGGAVKFSNEELEVIRSAYETAGKYAPAARRASDQLGKTITPHLVRKALSQE